MSTYPRTFSHIGISVPDVEQAANFYSEVMGWYHIMEPTVITEESDTPIGQMCIDVFGQGWGSFKIAHMSTGDKIGVEMFEFKNNETPKDFEYWKTSTFHFCVQDPDIEGLVAKIVEHGGKQRMPIREYYPGEKPYRMCYVEDPFGLIFEVYSHSYELTYSQGAYQKVNKRMPSDVACGHVADARRQNVYCQATRTVDKLLLIAILGIGIVVVFAHIAKNTFYCVDHSLRSNKTQAVFAGGHSPGVAVVPIILFVGLTGLIQISFLNRLK